MRLEFRAGEQQQCVGMASPEGEIGEPDGALLIEPALSVIAVLVTKTRAEQRQRRFARARPIRRGPHQQKAAPPRRLVDEIAV